jgi:glycosyltransferase involved in cell wall biosynthesis
MFRKPVAVILVPTLSFGDATGTDVFGMREALQSTGYEVRIFTDAAEAGSVAEPARKAFSFLRRHRGLVIYHHGIQWESGTKLLDLVRGPLIIRDHNVTPSRFFEGINNDYFENTRSGFEQRRALAGRSNVARYLPCSNFSASELTSFGANPKLVTPLPPLHNIDRLINTDSDGETLKRWSQDPADILFVGRIAPNKGHRRLIRLAAIYQELFGESLRVRFVGPISDELQPWQQLLMEDAGKMGLRSQIDITGAVSIEELKTAYLTSRLFVSCSEHEGFCVPLVEASAMGLPILIGEQSAMVETMGDVAMAFSKTQDDAMATMIHRLLKSPVDRENVRWEQQLSMKRRFAREVLLDRFLEIVHQVRA